MTIPAGHSFKRVWAGSVRRQIALAVGISLATLCALFVTGLVRNQQALLDQGRSELAGDLARLVAEAAAPALIADDRAGLDQAIAAAERFTALEQVMIVDEDGRVLAQTDALPAPWTDLLIESAAPIFSEGRVIGEARLALGRSDIAASVASLTRQGALFAVAATLAGVLLVVALTHGITSGLRRLLEAVQRVRAGDRDFRPEISRVDEIGQLAGSIGNMLKGIVGSELALRRANDTLSSVFDASPVAVVALDRDQIVLSWNKAAESIFGYSAEEAVGRSYWTMVPESEIDSFSALCARVAAGEKISNDEVKHHRKDESILKLRRSAAPLTGAATGPGGVVLTLEPITDRKQAAADPADPAPYDPLTGLPSREQFRQILRDALDRARKRNNFVAVLCLNVDRFTAVSNALGPLAGDALLQAVADRLRELAKGDEMVARLGGDEFAVVQAGIKDHAEASALARRLIRELAAAYTVLGQEVALKVNVGVSIGPADSGDPDALLKKAGVALYRAQADGSEAERFFEPKMDAELEKRRTLARDLGNALANGELENYYQPIVNLEHGQVSGCEALVRWRHPERGMVSPGDFIPLAEDTGLIIQIGEWVLRQACTEAARWPHRLKVAVNLSTVQFRSKNLVPTVMSALASSGLAPDRLELEVTESVLMQENAENLALLHQLRGLGVRIAMDDFGTGYSSLGYLRSFPFNKIKIDRSFVKDLPHSDECLAIVRAVAGLANSLGLTTTAEGIETEQQLRRVRNEGCTEGQGYLFSPPISSTEIQGFLVGASSALKRTA